MVDIAAIPDGFKNSVGKTERHDVLDGLFSEIVVDAINLLFIGDFQNLLVERLRRLQVVTEGFLDDHAPPVIIALLHQPIRRELFHNGAKETWSGCKVIKEVLLSGVVAVDPVEALLDLGVKLVVFEITGEIIKAAREAIPQRFVDAVATIFFNIIQDSLAKI